MATAGGVTHTEQLLALFGERSFLKLWSYANPHKDDGHELCDLLAVFGDTVFVFFDRAKQLPESPAKDPQIVWDRWKRDVVEAQVRTAHGAERYIRSGRPIFLDAARTKPFPLPVPTASKVFKFVVAHGAAEACKAASPQNVSGSLAITYGDPGLRLPSQRFFVDLDRDRPVHVLDSHTMPIVLTELDTVTDLARYLEEKERAIATLDMLSYCGEEDLLAHYLLNYDKGAARHVIVNGSGSATAVMIGEGEWHGFSNSSLYANTKGEDRISYFWDELIDRTCGNASAGVLGGNSDIFAGKSAIIEMVKEPRFSRRALAARMLDAVEAFPPPGKGVQRQITMLPSFEKGTAYVLLQLGLPPELRAAPDLREKRQFILEVACGVTKNKFPDLRKVVGIGIENPKYTENNTGEDFILLNCEQWGEEERKRYEELNEVWQFYSSPGLKEHREHVTQFVPPPKPTRGPKVGRNDPCPCGSGKKFKHCHGR